MQPYEKPGQRGLRKDNIDTYLNNINDDLSKQFAAMFLKHVTYIPFNVFYQSLQNSLNKFLSTIADKPYAILLEQDHYGSESWLTQLLFQTELLGKEPDIISKANPNKDPIDIVIIDDAIYSGINTLSKIDNFIYYANQNGKILTPERYIFHIVVPYVSISGYNMLCKNIDKFGNSKLYFYTNLPLIKSIWQLEPSMKNMFQKDNEELHDVIVKNLNIDPHTDFVPIYFDHKIACELSTAMSILQKVVTPLPSRSSLLNANKNFYNVN